MWLYAVVIPTGALLWLFVWGLHIQAMPDSASEDTIGLTGVLMILDVVLGVMAVASLPFRHRAPLAVALVVSSTLVVSASAIGAAVVAVVYLAIVGTRAAIALSGAVWLLAILANGSLVLPAIGAKTSPTEMLTMMLLGAFLFAVLWAIGRYRRARAETITILRERAESVERERERDVQAAREAERLRIAREMHDVLAHRISIVSMHAGALTYRDDLPNARITEAAEIIQESTALALSELRELLGVLRDTNEDDPHGPQPTLQHLPILLTEARAAGVTVTVDYSGLEFAYGQPRTAGLSDSTSRTGYRIVQEALTNARKHAAGEPVHLQLEHTGDALIITCRNRRHRESLPSSGTSGLGLVGLTERAHLAGGTLAIRQESGEFVVEVTLPWS